MISVENFYWALYSNLLKPLELDAVHYYPWGTTQTLNRLVFHLLHRRYYYNHVLFYDQEPIWNDDLGNEYDVVHGALYSTTRYLKILANSEQSATKKQICKDRHMIDWYYFYHGFAALDWYRDAKYIDHDHDIHDAFLCLNHVISHNRSYRIALLARLIHRDAAHRGRISWHHDLETTMSEVANPYNSLSDQSRDLCQAALVGQTDLPWKFDDTKIDGAASAHFGHYEYAMWQRSFLHVVNETVFYQAKLHLTEKCFKPIVAQRPFVLVAGPGNLAYLKSYGFQTFGDWIDESYDAIQDPDQRLDAIANEVARFAAMSLDQLRNIHRDMQSVLMHNRRHFFGEFRRIIVDELVDNFDQCIRIWNNGRVDNHELPLHPDLDRAKQILLG